MLTWVEINRAALEHNIHSLRSHLGHSTLLIPVVKSNAYGHGIVEVSRICDDAEEIDRIAVLTLDDALLIRVCGIRKPILIISFFEQEDDKVIEAIKKNIIFPVFTLKQAKYLDWIGKSVGMQCTVHIKIDAGNTKTGFTLDEVKSYAKELKKFDHLTVEGMWNHLSSGDTKSETKRQYNFLEKCGRIFAEEGMVIPMKHLACYTSAALFPFSKLDAVRLGISLYGIYPFESLKKQINLKPVIAWKTTVIQIKNAAKGQKAGGTSSFKAKKESKLAILPIGYYDGYKSAWAGKAEVLVRGRRCKVKSVGMNVTLIDVTKIPGIEAGDTVTLIGTDGKEDISVRELQNLLKSKIHDEITSVINPLIKRNVI